MRNPYFLFGIFAAFGLLFFSLGAFFTFNASQKNTWQEQEGVITGFDARNYPYISFTYDGKQFEVLSSFTSSDMEEGEVVKVQFPVGQPQDAEIKSFISTWLLPMIFSGFGLIFGSIGTIGIRYVRGKQQLKHELFELKQGKKLTVPVSSVDRNTSYKVNGVSPFVIIAQWHEMSANVVHEFRSENIWFDPSSFLNERKEVDVYVDPRDPKRYHLALPFFQRELIKGRNNCY